MYPANQLSTLGKLGVYVERWWEFLTDEPREAKGDDLPKDLPIRHSEIHARIKSLGKILPSKEEIARKPRSRSAVLRVAPVLVPVAPVPPSGSPGPP